MKGTSVVSPSQYPSQRLATYFLIGTLDGIKSHMLYQLSYGCGVKINKNRVLAKRYRKEINIGETTRIKLSKKNRTFVNPKVLLKNLLLKRKIKSLVCSVFLFKSLCHYTMFLSVEEIDCKTN